MATILTSRTRGSHTPGPWELHHDVGGVNSVRVCVPDATTERGCRPIAEAEILGVPRRVAEANARLIAAAPELLATVKALVASVDDHDADMAGTGHACADAAVLTAARAAIVKAEGTS